MKRMKREIIILTMCAFCLAGCSLFKRAPLMKSTKTVTAPMTVYKREAIRIAKEFLIQNEFSTDFNISRPHKISKAITLENNPRWVWRIHFPIQKRSFWKFWKRSSLMVEVDASKGRVIHWGRR